MRRILVLTSLLAAAACGPGRTDLEVHWTFGGQPCDVAGVVSMQVDVAGEVLSPNVFECTGFNSAGLGADLGTYLNGPYQVTVTGFDGTNGTGSITHQVTQTIQVRGGGTMIVEIDVPPNEVTLHWTFQGQSCAQAGVAFVNVTVDGVLISGAADNPDLPCTSGGIDGTTIGPLGAGPHSFDLVGVDSGHTARYALNGLGVTAMAGSNVVASANLLTAAPTSASAHLTWTFDGKGCAAAGVSQVRIYVDPDAGGNGGTNAGTVACSTNGTEGADVENLTEGTHSFAILGINNGVLLYRTHAPPSANFRVGLITNVPISAESPP